MEIENNELLTKAPITLETNSPESRDRAALGYMALGRKCGHATRNGDDYATELKRVRGVVEQWGLQTVAGWNWFMDQVERAERIDALEAQLDEARAAAGIDAQSDLAAAVETHVFLLKGFSERAAALSKANDELRKDARDYQQLRDWADTLIVDNAKDKQRWEERERELVAAREMLGEKWGAAVERERDVRDSRMQLAKQFDAATETIRRQQSEIQLLKSKLQQARRRR